MSSSNLWPDPAAHSIITPGPHLSYLDGPLLALLTPRPILFAVTPDFALHPVWRPLLLSIGRPRGCSMIPMRPGSISGVRPLLRHLRAGGWVCIFPSGGLQNSHEHPGAAWLSEKSGVKIHKITLHHGPGFGKLRAVWPVVG